MVPLSIVSRCTILLKYPIVSISILHEFSTRWQHPVAQQLNTYHSLFTTPLFHDLVLMQTRTPNFIPVFLAFDFLAVLAQILTIIYVHIYHAISGMCSLPRRAIGHSVRNAAVQTSDLSLQVAISKVRTPRPMRMIVFAALHCHNRVGQGIQPTCSFTLMTMPIRKLHARAC